MRSSQKGTTVEPMGIGSGREIRSLCIRGLATPHLNLFIVEARKLEH